jgi:hypothetical protein
MKTYFLILTSLFLGFSVTSLSYASDTVVAVVKDETGDIASRKPPAKSDNRRARVLVSYPRLTDVARGGAGAVPSAAVRITVNNGSAQPSNTGVFQLTDRATEGNEGALGTSTLVRVARTPEGDRKEGEIGSRATGSQEQQPTKKRCCWCCCRRR